MIESEDDYHHVDDQTDADARRATDIPPFLRERKRKARGDPRRRSRGPALLLLLLLLR